MAQGNPSRKKRFSFFGKTRSEAHQPPPGQSHPGSFTSVHSKAKDLVTRRAGQPKPSQGNSPSADPTESYAQLTVPEERANELPNMSANNPVSLKDPPSDRNHNVSTSDLRAQLQSDKLPTTVRSMDEGQTVHSAESNDSATKVTNKSDLDEVDAARRHAREAVSGLNPVFGPVQAVALGINDAGDPVAAVDYVTPLLGTVSKFNSIVDTIAEIHPYAKAAWDVLSVVPKTIISQTTRDGSLRQLFSKMNEVYMFLTETDLESIKTMKTVITRVCQQTLECSYFIRDYSKSKNFWTRLGRNVVSETDETVKRYNAVFDDLMQQFRDRAVRGTVVVVHRMLEDIQELMKGADLSGMKCAEGAGLDTRKKCLPGTREEILDEITTWINNTEDDSRVFWLHGNAGTGKSFIAHTIADRFRGLGRLGSCYCFDRTRAAQRRHEKVFTTIARGLADRDDQMRHALADVVHHDNSLTDTPDIMQQWKELIMKPASKLSEAMVGPTLIVIEALDESGDHETRRHLLRILAGKLEDDDTLITKLPPNFRILITSRPLPDIRNALNNVQHVQQKSMDDISSMSTERDILRYVTNELTDVEGIHDDELLPSLARESGRLFEWARLACVYVGGEHSPGRTLRERFKDIISHNDDHVPLLDQMYKLTLENMFPKNQQQRKACLDRFCSVMAQVLGTLEPLPLASLCSMKCHFPDESDPEIVTSIINSMAALLSGITDPSAIVRPLHASFPDFLTDKERSGEFFVDTSRVHKDLAFASLGVMKHELRFNICRLPSSYLPNSEIADLDERVKQHISPELSYSCRFWTDHLRKAVFNLGLAEVIRAFFNHKRLLFWFEVLSLLKMVNTTAGSLSSVIEWVEPHPTECTDISHDAADAQRFMRMFGLPISFSTPHLYVSALPFSPKESRIFTKFANAFPSVLRIVSGHNVSWPVIQQVMYADSAVLCAAFSPDGKHIVLGLSKGIIQVWDAETGERLRLPLVGHQIRVNSVAFSPDGKRIVSGSSDNTIRLWDAVTGQPLRPPLKGHTSFVTSVAFSPDGTRIVSGSWDHTIRLWDVETGELLRPPLKEHTNYVTSVAFSPDGTRIVSGSWDHTIRLWNAETGEPLRPPLKGHTNHVTSVTFSPDGTRIMSGSWDQTIRLWDAETGEPLRPPLKGHTNYVTSVAFSPNSEHIVSGSEDHTVRLWDAETGKPLQPPLEGHESGVTSVAFSLDGKRILSGSYDSTSHLWESTTGEPLHPPLVQHDFICSAAFTPDGKGILSESCHNIICLSDAETGEPLRPPLKGAKNDVLITSVAFSPDGKRIVLGLSDHTIMLLDSETGELLQPPLKKHRHSVISVAFSPDGKCIASGSRDKTICLWDTKTGELLRPLMGHEGAVWSVAFSPNGEHIVSGSWDCTVRLWDAKTGKSLIPPLVGHKNVVTSVSFSPNGKHIVSGSDDMTIRLWVAETGKPLWPPLEGHESYVTSVAFSLDGKCIVSGSDENTIRLWDTQTGKPLRSPLKGHESSFASVAFSPDGQHIMSLSYENTMQLWDVETPEELQPHLIRFSVHPGHSLVDPTMLLDEINASTQHTSALPVRIRDDNWVVIGPKNRLLFWVPPTYNPRWCPPGMRWIVPALNPPLDLSHMAHGLSWESCYRTHARV